MTLTALPGTGLVPIGMGYSNTPASGPGGTTALIDAANEAIIFIGYVVTSDGGSHTIDTTGSSSLGWRTGAVTFANAGTTVKVGLAAVDMATGPPGRAANASGVITFDVARSMTGGGGGITTNTWHSHVPTTGTKTIANGDFIAFCIQMTSVGGVDSILTWFSNNVPQTLPIVTTFLSATYAVGAGVPNCIITFSDGALGYFYGSDVFGSIQARAWDNTGSPKEYGQLYNLPFPLKIYGLYGWLQASANCDIVLYSAPLSGTPVAEKTITVDLNTISANSNRKFAVLFPTPYTLAANTDIAAVFKPGAASITASYKTYGIATHRITEPFGTSGYGISRSTGAFANASSSLDHYYIGLLAGSFDSGGTAGRAVQVNDTSLVAA